MLFLNYTSGKATDGDGSHNHTTIWMVQQSQTAGNGGNISAAQWINIPETNWFKNNLAAFVSGVLNVPGGVSAGAYISLSVEGSASELAGITSFYQEMVASFVTENEIGWHPFFERFDFNHWDRWAGDPETVRMDIEGSRRVRLIINPTHTQALMFYFTYHSVYRTVTRAISGSAGGTVNIAVHDKTTGDLLASTSRSGDGNYSVILYDDVNTKFSVARENATHVGRSEDFT
jgi:hypothetical protein